MFLKKPKKGWKRPARGFNPNANHRDYDGEEQTEVPPQVHLKPIIDKTLTACSREKTRAFLPSARSEEPRATYVIHSSQAGGCRRKAFFSFVEAPKDEQVPDPRLQRIFDVGHEGHRRIQGYLFEAWKRGIGEVTHVWEDVKLRIPDLVIEGEYDAAFELADSDRYLVEVKTMAKTSMERLTRPKIEWDWQAHIYMRAVGLKAAILLVECKDNQEMREFWVPFSDKTWDEIETACTEMIEYAVEHEVPDEIDKSGCRFCDYKLTCEKKGSDINWKKVDKRVEFPLWAK